jgi:hypothetical protein
MLWKRIRPWVPVACLMCSVPADFAATISIDESITLQTTLPATAGTGTVLVCEWFHTFGAACDNLSYVSDQLIFASLPGGGGVTVKLFSNSDADDNVDGTGTGLTNVGTIVIGEGFFGGFDYTPGGTGDPGFDTTSTTQTRFLFAGDSGDPPGEVPEPASFSLLVVGVLLLFVACRWKQAAQGENWTA